MTTKERGRIRANFHLEISLLTAVKKIDIAQSKDISLNGIFVETTERLPVGTECRVLIKLTGTEPSIILSLDSEVVRSDPHGLGITFKKMEIDDYEHLKNIVMYNTKNPDEFLEQCQKRPGFK